MQSYSAMAFNRAGFLSLSQLFPVLRSRSNLSPEELNPVLGLLRDSLWAGVMNWHHHLAIFFTPLAYRPADSLASNKFPVRYICGQHKRLLLLPKNITSTCLKRHFRHFPAWPQTYGIDSVSSNVSLNIQAQLQCSVPPACSVWDHMLHRAHCLHLASEHVQPTCCCYIRVAKLFLKKDGPSRMIGEQGVPTMDSSTKSAMYVVRLDDDHVPCAVLQVA